jgi:hypothetical protein
MHASVVRLSQRSKKQWRDLMQINETNNNGWWNVTDPEEALRLHSAIQKVEKELADAEESWLLLQEDDSVLIAFFRQVLIQ